MASQLEGIHNNVHATVGGNNGHMSFVDVAAFDPIFMLHHANVDRLALLYQAIYPANRQTPSPGRATFARIVPGRDGSNDDLNTNLYPFKMNSNYDYFTGNELKTAGTVTKYKYGYEDFPCSYATTSATTISSQVRARVNALYGPSSASSKARRNAAPIPDANPMALAIPDAPSPYTPQGDQVAFERNDYYCRFVVDHAEIPGSWTCNIFFGKPSGSPSDYYLDQNRVAMYSSFGSPGVRRMSMPYPFEVALTEALLAKGQKLDQASVTKYLEDNMYYKITTNDLPVTEIPIENLKTFKVGCYTAQGKYPDIHSSQLPTWGQKTYLFKITNKKGGGATSQDELDNPELVDGRREKVGHQGEGVGTY